MRVTSFFVRPRVALSRISVNVSRKSWLDRNLLGPFLFVLRLCVHVGGDALVEAFSQLCFDYVRGYNFPEVFDHLFVGDGGR